VSQRQPTNPNGDRPKGYKLACVVFGTELFEALKADGYIPEDTSGTFRPATSALIRKTVLDFLQLPTAPAQPPRTDAENERLWWERMDRLNTLLDVCFGDELGFIHLKDGTVYGACDAYKHVLTGEPMHMIGQRTSSEPQYHPATPILVEGLKKLPGGQDILAQWDSARALIDGKPVDG